jgi:hypothetical protein
MSSLSPLIAHGAPVTGTRMADGMINEKDFNNEAAHPRTNVELSHRPASRQRYFVHGNAQGPGFRGCPRSASVIFNRTQENVEIRDSTKCGAEGRFSSIVPSPLALIFLKKLEQPPSPPPSMSGAPWGRARPTHYAPVNTTVRRGGMRSRPLPLPTGRGAEG